MKVETYLFFEGRCEEALQFYRRVLGAEVAAMVRYQEGPDPAMYPPDAEDKIMHATFRIGDTTLMASDGRCEGAAVFQGFALTLSVTDQAEAQSLFSALSDGGEVLMPLAETFFSPLFGMLTDRFGVSWMIIVAPEGQP